MGGQCGTMATDRPTTSSQLTSCPAFRLLADTRPEAEAEFALVLREYLEAVVESGRTPTLPLL